MNFRALESEQKLRGGFYTDATIAAFLVKWIKHASPRSLLEPSCGDGAFFSALEQEHVRSLKKIVGFELDPVEAQKAQTRTRLNSTIVNEDFLRWYVSKAQSSDGFDAVVGNPPFIRYQYLPEEQQLLSEKVFAELKLPFTKHTNAWVPFVLASIRLLRPGGRIAMVIPSEIFHIPHAQSLRRYLAEQCSRVLIFDPEEIWFTETLQGTVLLLAEKKHAVSEKGKGVAVIPVSSRQILLSDPEEHFNGAVYANGATIEGKWMPLFLSTKERSLLTQIRAHENVKRFKEVASVDVGIVTGANSFFLVPDRIVEEFCLQKWAHPMFGRSEHVKGLIYSREDHLLNKKIGLPANFLWFKEEDLHQLPAKTQQYLKIGLKLKLQTRYKCRTRSPWYTVPSVYTSAIGMLKRAHHYPRLILNTARAYTTDTAYRVTPIGITSEALVFGFVNSLTCLTAEMEGRHYGGGVLELVPSEIERLLVPVAKATEGDLSSANLRFRNAKDDCEFLRKQDSFVLGKIGLSTADQNTLHNAWLKLKTRRHRVPSTAKFEEVAA